MNILFAASEVFPFCKTGGLADVAGSLPTALAAAGVETAVVLPLYQSVAEAWKDRMTFAGSLTVSLAWRHQYCGLFRLVMNGVTYYFLDNEYYFKRPELYGYFDDGERFGFFSRAVTELLPLLDRRPSVVHCNDWQTALIPVYLRQPDLAGEIKTVLTIHNIEYQGRYPRNTLEDLFGLSGALFDNGIMEYYGDICLLKGGLLCCDRITTVSPTYASELRYPFYAHGMEGVVAACGHKLRGILNGIDTRLYDPKTDPSLWETYSAENPGGKAINKQSLRSVLGLHEEEGTAILACVTRLAEHKGMDLILEAFPAILELPVQFVLLGRGEPRYEEYFRAMQLKYPGRVSANIQYSAHLSSQIYSGADLFLMPSRSEPCGLAQMIAMRYGAIPVVRETGGLKDTVLPYDSGTETGTGFTFANYDAADMLGALRRAAAVYSDKQTWERLRSRCMSSDFSWSRSASEYKKIYRDLTGF